MLDLLDEMGYDLEDFEFVKNGRWIQVYHEPSNNYFGYRQKRHLPLNPLIQKWGASSSFEVKKGNGQTRRMDGFVSSKRLVRDFEGWVAAMSD